MLRREELLVSLSLILIISVLGYLINVFLGFGAHPILANVVFALIVINLYQPLRSVARKVALRLVARSYFERNEKFREFLQESEEISTYKELLEKIPKTVKFLFEAEIVALFVRRKGIFKVESSIAPKPIYLDGISVDKNHPILKDLVDNPHHLVNVNYSVDNLHSTTSGSPSLDYKAFKLFRWAIPLRTNKKLAAFILLDKMPMDMQARRSGTLYNYVVDQMAVLLEKRKLYHRIQMEASKQEALTLIATQMAETRNTTRIFNLLLDQVYKLVPFNACGVFLASDEDGTIEKFIQRGYNTRRLNPLKLKIGRGIVGKCIADRSTILIPDVRREKDYIAGRSESRSELCVPIAGGSQIYGAINLESNQVAGFSEDDLDFLETVATQAGVLMERYHIQKRADIQTELSEDIEKAEVIQRSILPANPPAHEDVEFAIEYLPCKKVSGDFYDISNKRDDVFTLAIGDVVGKGISGALIMSNFYAAYLNESQKGFPLATLVSNLNKYLTDDTQLDEQVTLFLSRMDVDEGVIRYVNAGHPAPIIFHPDHSFDRLEAGGPLLGFDPEFTYSMGEFKLQTNDLLLIYTDGITESIAKSGQLFDESGLIEILKSHEQDKVSHIAQAIIDTLKKFIARDTFEDDVTFILARYHGAPAEEQQVAAQTAEII